MKVHYVGWGRKFDEWRPISELSHFGFTKYIIRRDGLVEHQLRQISIAIQESLNGARRRDTSRSLKVSISERTWTELANVLWVKRVFIRCVFVACGQLFPLFPAERPVMRYYVLVCWSF